MTSPPGTSPWEEGVETMFLIIPSLRKDSCYQRAGVEFRGNGLIRSHVPKEKGKTLKEFNSTSHFSTAR